MDGLLVIDKPAGMTSHDVVNRLRKITGERSIGHLGTLDPMATGVLPLLMGRYTRLAQYFNSADKTYTGSIRFGFATDTYDAEGQMTGDSHEVCLNLEQVRTAALRFSGLIEQVPPPYSAKKVGGKPAYKMARAGETVELKAVSIRILEFRITNYADSEADFEMSVSAGGYVRGVAHELGRDLGCGGHLSRLRRVRAGVFGIEDAYALEALEALSGDHAALQSCCRHPRTLLMEMPAVTGDMFALGRFRNGAQANLPDFSQAPLVKVFADQRELIGIARRVAGTLFQPVAVLH